MTYLPMYLSLDLQKSRQAELEAQARQRRLAAQARLARRAARLAHRADRASTRAEQAAARLTVSSVPLQRRGEQGWSAAGVAHP